jgi:hypothetical protein
LGQVTTQNFMVKRLIEFPLESGGYVLVEVTESEASDSLGRIGREDELLQKSQQTFEAALDGIKPIASTLINKLRSLNQPADEVQVKFGLKMSAEAGAVIASASIEGNYEITLKWSRDQ